MFSSWQTGSNEQDLVYVGEKVSTNWPLGGTMIQGADGSKATFVKTIGGVDNGIDTGIKEWGAEQCFASLYVILDLSW